jgi:hypothetical protein
VLTGRRQLRGWPISSQDKAGRFHWLHSAFRVVVSGAALETKGS